MFGGECSVVELVHTVMDIISFDKPTVTGAEFVKYLTRSSRRYGFNFGFKELDGDASKLTLFFRAVSSVSDIMEITSHYSIWVYFQYLPYIQTYKDSYEQAEVFTEQVWDDIDKDGFCIVDVHEFMSIMGGMS